MEVHQALKQEASEKFRVRPSQKAKIIEFAGPPGAGKTSNCSCFTAALRHYGYSVLTLNDIKQHIRELSKPARTKLLLKTLHLHTPKVASYAFTLFTNRIYSLTSITRYMRIAVFDTALHQMIAAKKYDLVLLEQWMIQELWSATIFRLRSYDKIEKQLHPYYLTTDQLLYFDIDMETASKRITNRTSNLSRFDTMDPAHRIRKLTQYNAYLYNLYKYSRCPDKHVISTKNTPEENASLFLHQLI